MDENQDTTTPVTDTSTSVMEVAKKEALDDMMDRFQAYLVREPISDKIKEFEAALAKIAQKTAVFLIASKRINISGDPTIANEHTIVDAINRMSKVSNDILKYIDFMKEKTGLPSGGDTSLEKDAKAGARWAKNLLDSFKLLKEIERTAGGLIGLDPSRVEIECGQIYYCDKDGNWLLPDILNPLLRSPGTPWHKLLSGRNWDCVIEDRVVPDYQHREYVDIHMPNTLFFIYGRHMVDNMRYGAWFSATGHVAQDPGQVEANMAALYCETLEVGLAPYSNWHGASEDMSPPKECLSERPEFTHSGRAPFEELNFTINQRVMDGRHIRAFGPRDPDPREVIHVRHVNFLAGDED